MRRWFWLSLVVLALLAPVGMGTAEGAGSSPEYLALGDSYAVGEGATNWADLGYVPVFHGLARGLPGWEGRDLALKNLAVSGGETSASMMASGGQLDKAKEELSARNHDSDPNNNVELITVDIGGNDLLRLMREDQPCRLEPGGAECLAQAAEAAVGLRANLPVIMRTIREAAGPDTIILALTYGNPFSGTGTPLGIVADLGVEEYLNKPIREAVADPALEITLVDIFPLFKDRGAELSHSGEERPDIHPTDAGHQVMAGALFEALQGLLQAEAASSSALPTTGAGPASQGGDDRVYAAFIILAGALPLAAGVALLARSRRRF
jgi:lysophospholipase L1-like esterase